MRLFGRGKKEQSAADRPQDSVMRIRSTVEMLEKKEKYLDAKIAAETENARKLVKDNKSAAMMSIKRRRMYETQREQMRAARFNQETLLMTIETAAVNIETFQTMQEGASAMKKMHGQLDIDKVDAAMDDVREQMDLASEITDAISQPLEGLGMSGALDEDELNAELEQLEQSELDRAMLDVGAPPVTTPVGSGLRAPAASVGAMPSAASPASAVDEDAELAQLRESMAL